MGLDMYLYKNTYVGAKFDHRGINGDVTIKNNEGVDVGIKLKRISSVTEEVGYWRKANHIHAWFVRNVQQGVDDCGEYDVTLEQLDELRKVCREVLAAKDTPEAVAVATEKLPTQRGFFFGGTEYDEYYYSDIEYTIRLCDDVIAECDALKEQHIWPDIKYQASW